MNDDTLNRRCERGADLLSFLYGETDELEARDFGSHLEHCEVCRSELAAFGQIRESISFWKQETLSTSLPPRVEWAPREKSALSALREFFDLSPSWLKGAVGFAVVAFSVMAVLTFASFRNKPNSIDSSAAKYSEDQLKQAVNDALRKQDETIAASSLKDVSQPIAKPDEAAPRKPTVKDSNSSTRWAKTPKPLSRSEREQLAADLRLLTTKDDDNLNLLGDRINQDF